MHFRSAWTGVKPYLPKCKLKVLISVRPFFVFFNIVMYNTNPVFAINIHQA
jgi:hypothetical protein